MCCGWRDHDDLIFHSALCDSKGRGCEYRSDDSNYIVGIHKLFIACDSLINSTFAILCDQLKRLSADTAGCIDLIDCKTSSIGASDTIIGVITGKRSDESDLIDI